MNRNFYVFFVLTLIGCKKYTFNEGETRLPRATERGRGIFACYIDGNTYIARRQEEITYNATTGYLFLANSNRAFNFRLFIYEGVFDVGNYIFDTTGEEWILSNYSKWFGIKPGGMNRLELTKLDIENEIIAGNFDLDLVDGQGEHKWIRDGRFDLKMTIIK